MSMFVGVGQDLFRISSADGVEWKHTQTGKEGQGLSGVAFGNGVFTAVGSHNYGKQLMAVSSDGIEWKVNLGTKAGSYRYITFGNGKFFAFGGDAAQVGDAKPFVGTTTDGVTWTDPKPISGRFIIRRIAFGNGIFVGVGDRGRRSVSTDGYDWKDAGNTKPIDTLIDIAFGNGVYVGVGMHGLRMSTKDGFTWTEPQRGKEGEHLNSIVFANGQFVSVGAGATFTSPDGNTWTRTPNKNAPLTCMFGGGLFIGTNWKGRILKSADALEWTEVIKCPFHVGSIAWG
jgi:hypothetical protein